MRATRFVTPCLSLAFALLACSSDDSADANDQASADGSGGATVLPDSGNVGAAGRVDSGAAGKGGASSGVGGSAAQGGASGGSGTGGHGGDAVTDAGADAGSGGTRTVGACNGLGAVDVWQNITPSAFTSPPNLEAGCVAINPNDQSVFAAAGNVTNGPACPSGTTCPSGGTGVYKSTDCGATWTKISTTHNLETGSCFGLLVDPVNPQTMYYNNGYGNNPTVYKSIDGGVSWDPLSTDANHVLQYNFVNSTAMDRADPKHLVVTYHESCAAPYAPNCLAESKDGGATWRQFKGPEANGWVEVGYAAILGTTQLFYSSGNGGWYSGDGGATWRLTLCWSGSGCLNVNSGVFPAHVASDGVAYVGAINGGMMASRADPAATPPVLLGQAWTKIPSSPAAYDIFDDGARLYASRDDASGQPYRTAPLSNPAVWTKMDSPNISRGSKMSAYDAAHHVLYTANNGAGIWRLVTQ
jgi:hypothetical protein